MPLFVIYDDDIFGLVSAPIYILIYVFLRQLGATGTQPRPMWR